MKNCPTGAVSLENNLAYIDYGKCDLCRKCEAACPQGSIVAINFPPLAVVSDVDSGLKDSSGDSVGKKESEKRKE